MFAKIISTGSYLPSKIMTNHDLEKMVDTSDEWITQRTGIKQRHIASDTQTTSSLALESSKQALKNANLNITDIDTIIVATATPDKTFPSTATILQHKLNATHNIRAFDINAVCSGFIYGLMNAQALIESKKSQRILLVGSEVFSKILDWKDRSTCVLFGDGSGAVIIEATPNNQDSHIIDTKVFSNGDYYDKLMTDGGVSEGNAPGVIKMDGQTVFKYAVNNMSQSAIQILQDNNLTTNQIDWLIPHQANIRIINSIAKKLNIPTEKIVITVQNHANTSSASIPLALDTAVQQNKLKTGDLILMEAMGAGFTWGSALIKW